MDSILLIAQGNNTLYWMIFWVVVGVIVIGGGIAALMIKCLRKVPQGSAIIRNGMGGTKVSFDRDVVIPILHIVEAMDISVKRIEIDRSGEDGLICKDNIRADIKVAFFVRVNKETEDVKRVAQFLGCARASDEVALRTVFEPKFSEAPVSYTHLTLPTILLV